MAFNTFANQTTSANLSALDANFTAIGTSDAASTLFPTATTSITYGANNTQHNFDGAIYAGQGVYTPTYTTATLPSATSIETGTQFWTSDNGLVVNNGTNWVSIGNTTPKNALTTVIIGNSITTAQKYGAGGIGDGWTLKSEIQIGSALSGSPLKFPKITATTRCDAWGTYGYSGATLSTILSDLQSQVWTPLQTAGVKPDIIVGGALLENDIPTGVSVASMQALITQFIRDAQARYPGVIILLATPHPSYDYNTPTKVANYQSMVSYLQSLDNGVDIFTSTINTYENSASPGTPLAGFTDATVHPNGKGSMRNARVFAATLRRIVASVKQSYYCIGSNIPFSGSAAASGTNVTGTVPTSVSIVGSANGTYVGLAEQPGFLETVTANAGSGGVPVDLGYCSVASQAYTGGANTQLSPFVEVEIVSGAENLAWINFNPRFNDGTNNIISPYIQNVTADIKPELQNGDIFTFRVPPKLRTDVPGLTSTFTAVQNYFGLIPQVAGGTFAVRFRTSGIGIVVA